MPGTSSCEGQDVYQETLGKEGLDKTGSLTYRIHCESLLFGEEWSMNKDLKYHTNREIYCAKISFRIFSEYNTDFTYSTIFTTSHFCRTPSSEYENVHL